MEHRNKETTELDRAGNEKKGRRRWRRGEAETVDKMNTVKEKPHILPWIIGKCLQGRPHPQKAPVSTVQMDQKEIVQLLRLVLGGLSHHRGAEADQCGRSDPEFIWSRQQNLVAPLTGIDFVATKDVMRRGSCRLASQFQKAVEARQGVAGSDSLKEAPRSRCRKLWGEASAAMKMSGCE